MTYSDSPASIHNQVGRALLAVESAIAENDLEKAARQVRFLVARVSPVLDDKERSSITFPRPPNARHNKGEEQHATYFEELMMVVERTMRLAVQHRIYAFPEPTMSDPTGLRPLGDEDEEEEAISVPVDASLSRNGAGA